MFSISAIAAAASSLTSRTSTGTASSPASRAARKRRSPAMISYTGRAPRGTVGANGWPAALVCHACKRASATSSGKRRTSTGCMMPWARMLSANSYRAPSSMRVRGWY